MLVALIRNIPYELIFILIPYSPKLSPKLAVLDSTLSVFIKVAILDSVPSTFIILY